MSIWFLSGEGSLDGVVISDGEGGFRFPSGARIDGEIIIAAHGADYQMVHGAPPQYPVVRHIPA